MRVEVHLCDGHSCQTQRCPPVNLPFTDGLLKKAEKFTWDGV